ncbi:MAG TPA: hypothetical protein VLJ60_05445 [bacterium]|nr:hypothetical protein [bacterium]
MTLSDDIKLYLPKYLSEEGTRELLKNLKQFPNNIDSRFYTRIPLDKEVLLQGDGFLDGFPVTNLPESEIKSNIPVIIISNTCDNDENNNRKTPRPFVSYCPIVNFQKFENMLFKKFPNERDSISSILESIKKQMVTNILFLPAYQNGLKYDGIVFFDKIISSNAEIISIGQIPEKRLFSLSDYGFYVFLFKLSIHFTRIQENVSRS